MVGAGLVPARFGNAREGNHKGLPLRKLTCHFRVLTINEKHQDLFNADYKTFTARIPGTKDQPQP